jgi:Cu/Zn superoxide dismutase
MKAHIVTMAAVIVAASAPAAYAANETITMHAIDASGVGKEIGTLSLSDTNAGLAYLRATMGFHVPRRSGLWARQRAERTASGRHGGGRPLRSG